MAEGGSRDPVLVSDWFPQHGKYFHPLVPERRDTDRSLHPAEVFILRLLHHLIAVQVRRG